MEIQTAAENRKEGQKCNRKPDEGTKTRFTVAPQSPPQAQKYFKNKENNMHNLIIIVNAAQRRA